jgi:formylglycine-generating enzyme required for sulfatase activity
VELQRPTEVGSYPPNPFGLYDMHGNVDEWVADWFEEGYYRRGPAKAPPGPDEGDEKVIRGGSWRGQGEDCRAAVRIGEWPDSTEAIIGFRVVLAPKSKGS